MEYNEKYLREQFDLNLDVDQEQVVNSVNKLINAIGTHIDFTSTNDIYNIADVLLNYLDVKYEDKGLSDVDIANAKAYCDNHGIAWLLNDDVNLVRDAVVAGLKIVNRI